MSFARSPSTSLRIARDLRELRDIVHMSFAPFGSEPFPVESLYVEQDALRVSSKVEKLRAEGL